MYKTILLSLLLLTQHAIGVVVTIDFYWSDYQYGLSEGSIIQIVAYNRGESPNPRPIVGDIFEQSEDGAYNPYSVADQNSEIVYQSSLFYDGQAFYLFSQFELLDYNRIYVRFFPRQTLMKTNLQKVIGD